MSGPVEDLFEDFDTDFLSQDFLKQNEFADCVLSDDALSDFLTPPQETWKDFLPKNHEAIITMNRSKDVQWKLGQAEIAHVRKRIMHLLSIESFEDVNAEDLFGLCFGPKNEIGKLLCEELEISEEKYLRFLSTICIQGAYHQTSNQLFGKRSFLNKHVPMSEEEYNGLWKKIAEKKKLLADELSTNRREKPLWEKMELVLNELFREISIVGREGRISISLDDDKIWAHLSNSGSDDLFGLKYATHVKPNRKGFILHTALSTALTIPNGAAFERGKDITVNCFRRILDFLFNQNGSTNLRNVSVHSDRGYMIPMLVFEYLLLCGAEVVGTTKRMAQCWPFTYKQKLKPDDKRTLLDTKGAPALLLKWCKAGAKHIFASAFRNGSDRIATAISTMHTQHHWEGVILNEKELELYKMDDKVLIPKFFQRCSNLFEEEESVAENEAMEHLLDNEVDPFTLRQGEFI